MSRTLSFRPLRGQSAANLVLALLLGVASTGSILTGEVVEGPVWLTLPVALACAAAVAMRTTWPIWAAATVALAGLAQALGGTESPGTLMALVATLLVVYSAGAEREEGAAAVGLALVLGSSLVQEWLDHGSDYAFITIEIAGVWLLGRAARSWRSRATYAEQHQRDLARLAVAEERTRIARDLHDVVAHSLSVIAVQADAAEAALQRDPTRAAEPLRAIRSSARDALTDMRQMLHLLRAEDTDAPADRAPARSVSDLTQLVDGMAEAGLQIQTEIRLPDDLPAGLGLAVYRIAQEGLTNVRRHAGPVRTRLVVVDQGHQVRVEISNEAPATVPAWAVDTDSSTGHGLIGARERALAVGGTLQAGTTESGGFTLVAHLPLNGSVS